MTMLYKSIPITSAEQAEQLPIGTVATSAQDGGGTWKKRTTDTWAKASMKPALWTNHGMANPDAAIVALMPIEADEIHSENRGGFFVTERHAVDPFVAYYAHQEDQR